MNDNICFIKKINKIRKNIVRQFRKDYLENGDLREIALKDYSKAFRGIVFPYLRFDYLDACMKDIKKHPEKYKNLNDKHFKIISENTEIICAYLSFVMEKFALVLELIEAKKLKKGKEKTLNLTL